MLNAGRLIVDDEGRYLSRRVSPYGYELVLLSQKVAGDGAQNHLLEAIPTAAWEVAMGRHDAKDIESRFADYVEGLVSVIGHRDRAEPLRDYCLGLVMPGERK